MSYEFKLPELGEGVMEGEIVQWLVSKGDTVAEDQPLLELMTDKATVSVPSPKAGKVLELRGSEGDVVEVGQVLVVLDAGGGEAGAEPEEPEEAEAPKKGKKAEQPEEAAEKEQAEKEEPTAKASPKAAKDEKTAATHREETPARSAPVEDEDTPPARLVHGLPARTSAPPAGRIPPARRQTGPTERVMASPSVRRKARELGVDLQSLEGTGGAGRITEADVRRAAGGEAPEAPAPAGKAAPAEKPAAPRPPYNLPPGVEAPPPGGERRVPFRGLRKLIAEKMQQSVTTAAHFTFVDDVDMRRLMALRGDLKEEAAAQGAKLTFLPFFVKAAVQALQRHPQLNVTLDEEAGEIVYRGYYNIGLAVATDRGLMVVNVEDADQLSLVEMALEIERLAEAARAGKATREELTGTTFTITSLGAQGGLFATPVINFPEVAIMGIHEIKDQPIVEDGQVVPGKVMRLSLSFDHRLVDGHVGAAFGYEVKTLLEQPERLMLEMR